MNHTDTFHLHGKIDIEPILKIISDNNMDWDEYTDRQKKYVAHTHTKTIPIIFDKSFNFNHLKIIPTEHYQLFEEEILKIEEKIKSGTGENGKIMRALLVNLTAGKSIVPHVDTVGFTLVLCRRIHIPLQTNEKCFFTVGVNPNPSICFTCFLIVVYFNVSSTNINERARLSRYVWYECYNWYQSRSIQTVPWVIKLQLT
jgi:hypothetical protein